MTLVGAYVSTELRDEIQKQANENDRPIAGQCRFLFREAVRSPLSAKGWLPIADIPKDGTRVLVWGEGMKESHEAVWDEKVSWQGITHFHYKPEIPTKEEPNAKEN